jgi:hypothetical protein
MWKKFDRNKNGVMGHVGTKPGGACRHQLTNLGCSWGLFKVLKCFLDLIRNKKRTTLRGSNTKAMKEVSEEEL